MHVNNNVMAEENQIYVVQNLTMCKIFPFEFQIQLTLYVSTCIMHRTYNLASNVMD